MIKKRFVVLNRMTKRFIYKRKYANYDIMSVFHLLAFFLHVPPSVDDQPDINDLLI